MIKDPEKRKLYQKRYRDSHKEELRIKNAEYRKIHRKQILKYRREHRDEIKASLARRGQVLKKLVTEKYGDKNGGCICCGVTELCFLSIDHIKDDGYKDRQENKGKLYWRLVKENFPKDFQTLCHNCQWGKRMHKGFCPHHPRIDLRKS
jgi:hypothetical protein